MSSREDYPWTDEAKNLKEGFLPTHKRETKPKLKEVSEKDGLISYINEWMETVLRHKDAADPIKEAAKEIKPPSEYVRNLKIHSE